MSGNLCSAQYSTSVMRLLLISCLIAITSAEEESKCEGLDVRGKFHKKEVLAIGLNRPYQLAYYKPRNEIFFTYNVGADEEDKFEIGWIVANSTTEHNKHTPITEVKDGFAIAIDDNNHMAYFGGSEGVYSKILKDGSSITQIIENHNIWDMFFKHHLYFITYPSQRLYKLEPGHKKAKAKAVHQSWIHEKIYQFAIDGNGDIFITNDTGLYMINNATGHRHYLEGENVFRAIEIDNKGEAHFCGKNGIYVPMKKDHKLHKIAEIKNLFGLAFDGEDHIIYSNPHQIVKLVPSVCNIKMVPDSVPAPVNRILKTSGKIVKT